MQDRSASPPFRDILMFVVVLVLALLVYPWVMRKFFPPPKAAHAPAAQEQKVEKPQAEKKAEAKGKPGQAAKVAGTGEKPKSEAAKPAEAPKSTANKAAAAAAKKTEESRQWLTLGSVDPKADNPYRMLVTLSNEGASVARIELSSMHYRDLEDRSGYLGHLVMDDTDQGPGCLVQVVGAGTPAADAGIQPGDRIVKLTYREQSNDIDGAVALEQALRKTKPGQAVELTVRRGNKTLASFVTLISRPLEVVRPERKKPSVDWIDNGPLDAIHLKDNCPLSFLMTLQGIDEKNPNNLPPDVEAEAKWNDVLNQEMPGVALRNANWRIDSQSMTKVVFSRPLPNYHLTIRKTYELVKVEGDPAKEPDAKAYNLVLSVQITNDDATKHEVAYRLDGPNGLPVEGSWYVTSKTGRTWSAEGLRDVDYQLAGDTVEVATASQLSEKDKFSKVLGESTLFKDHPPQFFGVDAQYFNVSMILRDDKATAANLERVLALRAGDVAERRKTLTNTSFRLLSKLMPLEAKETSPPQRFEIFAGPKRPTLLAEYGLSGVITYGWPIFQLVAVPLTYVLEFFYGIVHNYGLAIIMLTILVRLAMFPMSRHQAQSAQLMQKVQPKLKELEKKYKGDWKALQAARQELLSKYNYNPSSGCLLMFLQIPIFLGLYRALQVDIELRGAPLLTHSIRWCSNLAAPDMLYNWSWFMPDQVNNGQGFPGFPLLGPMLGLGPYFNLFPVITLVLFLLQQKVMMPPAADEQAAQQQKIMKYVMVLMGLMFFKVAAGLCLYFIASTLWGVLERRYMPKAATADGLGGDDAPTRPLPRPERPTSAQREAIRRKKRGKK